jgi:hypothetical protein
MKISAFVLSLLIVILFSCRRGDFGEVRPDDPVSEFSENGIWVVNEGLFGFGNGDISFIHQDPGVVANSVFSTVNGFPPGDVPFYLLVDGDHILLSVNNSSKVYVLQRFDFQVKLLIAPVTSPRHIVKTGENSYAVSAFAHDRIYLLNTAGEVPDVTTIYTGKSTESLVVSGDYLYAANWSAYGGNFDNSTVQVIHIPSAQLIEEIQVTKEPNSMVVDKNGKLWVLCSGGFLNEETPALLRINMQNNFVEKEFLFSSAQMSPFALTIDRAGEELYFINQHIFKMSVTAPQLPELAWVSSSGENYYNLNAGVFNDTILVSDAGNYQVPGRVLMYSSSGVKLNEFTVGIIPGCMAGNR